MSTGRSRYSKTRSNSAVDVWMSTPTLKSDCTGKKSRVCSVVNASIGTIVAFTTLQTRLFFPVQSLLSVGVDIQTSTALFDRVFEYLDLPVDIEPGDLGLDSVRGDVTFEGVWFRYG